jgi:hypothetical protein
MNTAVMFMHALKETCALHCLLALQIAGPGPVTQKAVMAVTGFDDGAVSKGLQKLLALGLVTCSGEGYRTGWRLAGGRKGLPWEVEGREGEGNEGNGEVRELGTQGAEGLERAGENAGKGDAKALAGEGHEGEDDAQREEEIPQKAESGAAAVVKEEEELEDPPGIEARGEAEKSKRAIHVSSLGGGQQGRRRRRQRERAASEVVIEAKGAAGGKAAEQRAVRAKLLAVMAKAHVWPNLRRTLAEALAREDGEGWLRQALGWMCYGVRRFPRWDIGAVVYPALRDRLLVEPAFLPPEGLGFEAALAWAEAGGEDAARYTNQEIGRQPAVSGRQEASETTDPPAHSQATGSQPATDKSGGQPAAGSRHARPAAGAQPPARQAGGRPEDEGIRTTIEALIWARAQARLKAELPGAAVGLWLRGARLSALGEGRWGLTVPTPQARDWLSHQLRERLERAIGEGVRVEITCEC